MFLKSLNLKTKKEIIDILHSSEKGGYICCINANTTVISHENKIYHDLIKNSLGNICDGFWMSKVFNMIGHKAEYYSGPDIFIDTIKLKNYKNLLLGSNIKNLNALEKNLKDKMILKDKVLKMELPYSNVENFQYDEIAKKLSEFEIDFIWVSLGAPKQEIFTKLLWNKIEKNSNLNKVKLICVGAAFDFYSTISDIKRAPFFYRKIGLEWFWRLCKQPKKTFDRLIIELYSIPKIIIKDLFLK